MICNSAAYARSARTLSGNRADDRYYSHSLTRPLPAEVLADAIAAVTGVAERYGQEPAGTRAVNLFDARIPAESLDILGRCSREGSCEGIAATGAGLSRKLHMINGPLLNGKIADDNGRLRRAP